MEEGPPALPSVIADEVLAMDEQLSTGPTDMILLPATRPLESSSNSAIGNQRDSELPITRDPLLNSMLTPLLLGQPGDLERAAYEFVIKRWGDDRSELVVFDAGRTKPTVEPDSGDAPAQRTSVDHNFSQFMPEDGGIIESDALQLVRNATEIRRLRTQIDVADEVAVILRPALTGETVVSWHLNVDAALAGAEPRQPRESSHDVQAEPPYEDGGLVDVLATEPLRLEEEKCGTLDAQVTGSADVGMYRDIELVDPDAVHESDGGTEWSDSAAASDHDAELTSSTNGYLAPLMVVGSASLWSKRRRNGNAPGSRQLSPD